MKIHYVLYTWKHTWGHAPLLRRAPPPSPPLYLGDRLLAPRFFTYNFLVRRPRVKGISGGPWGRPLSALTPILRVCDGGFLVWTWGGDRFIHGGLGRATLSDRRGQRNALSLFGNVKLKVAVVLLVGASFVDIIELLESRPPVALIVKCFIAISRSSCRN